MTKRTHDHDFDLTDNYNFESLGSDLVESIGLEVVEQYRAEENVQSHASIDNVADSGSDSGSDTSESSDSSSSDVDQSATQSEPAQKNTWVTVEPPEDVADVKLKFKVNSVGVCNLPRSNHPMAFLRLFLTEEVLEMMVRNTNIYARYVLQQETMGDKFGHWYDVTLDEMKKFWSILINMGMSQRSCYEDFWSTHPSQFFPFFARVMALKRFESILFMFNMTSENISPDFNSEPDPLVEVDYLLQSFNKAFKRFYVPDQDLRLDESLIFAPKQDHYNIQYINKKCLTQNGIQQFEICDACSEYIYHIGLRNKSMEHSDSKNTIFDLLNEAQLAGKGYHLFIRQHLMSLKLSQQLLTVSTYVTGPVDKKNCEDLPSHIAKKQVKVGTTLYARSGDHLLIKYNSQKPVCLTSGGRAENQNIENAKCQQRIKSLIIRRYLKYISGKDKSYLHLTSTIAINSCWKKIAFKLVDLAIFNAYILFKSQKDIKVKVDRVRFIEDIVEKLAFQRESVPSYDLGGGHKLVKVPPTSSEQLCRVCNKRGKKVKYICPGCNVYVHERCFRDLKHFSSYRNSADHLTVRRQTGSCTDIKTSGIVEIIEIKEEDTDSDN